MNRPDTTSPLTTGRSQTATATALREREADRPAVILEWLARCQAGGLRVIAGRDDRRIAWSDVLQDVASVFRELRSQDVREGTRIGICADNSYEWIVLDLALLSIGAIPVALPVAEFRDTRSVDLAERFELAAIFAAAEASEPDEPAFVAPLDELLRGPRVSLRAPPSAPVTAAQDGAFTLAFSSGTGGRLKCLRVSWHGCATLIEAHTAAFPFRRDDRILVALPLSTFQQRYLTYLAIRNDCDVVLSTSRHLLRAMRDGKPTVILGPPNLYELAETRYGTFSRRRRLLMSAASSAARLVLSSSLRRRVRGAVFSPLHQLYGGAARLMLVGSAPVRPSTLRFFNRAGFALYQVYGMTETGFVTWNTPAANRIGSVGKPVYPGTVYVSDDDEVLVRHGWHLCTGYHDPPPEVQAGVFLADGIVATGDLGEFDRDGFLYLRGRKDNVLVSRGGHKIQLEELEGSLCEAPAINRVAVFKPSSGAGLAVAAWFAGDEAAARASLGELAERLNARLPLSMHLRHAALIRGDLSADSPLLNRNLKLNREAVRREAERRLEPLGRVRDPDHPPARA